MLDKASLADARALDAELKAKRKMQDKKEKEGRVRMWGALKAQEADARSPSRTKEGKRYPDTGEGGAKRRKYPDTGE